MLNFKVFGIFAALGTAVIVSPKKEEKVEETRRCFEYLEEFRGLASLAEPHLTGVGIVSHDISAVARRYQITSDSLSTATCRRALEFLPFDSTEQKRALKEARRMNLVLKNLIPAP